MALRIRRSIRLGPGIRLNLGRGGGSVSVGGRGVSANFGRRGVRTTLGIPGTGVSWSSGPARRLGTGGGILGLIGLVVVLWVLFRIVTG